MRGTLLIFSGPSGVGKGTIVKELRKRSDKIRLSVSATTRAPRPEDVEGVTYYFKTMEEFEAMGRIPRVRRLHRQLLRHPRRSRG